MALHSIAIRHGYDGIALLQNAATGLSVEVPSIRSSGVTARSVTICDRATPKKSITTTLVTGLAKNAKLCKVKKTLSDIQQ